jgi:isopentenyldiphosphate isomerase
MELWDIYDEHGNKTGKTIERGKPMSQNEYHLIVDVWIINDNNKFLISKRIPTKNPDPYKWEPTCGCAVTGDSSIAAAIRETQEELGIILNPQNGKLIKRLIIGIAIIDVWLFRQEVDINSVVLQYEEVDDVMWAAKDTIKQLITDDKFINTDVRAPYIDELFEICGL